jgi:predicted dehydrogenase
VRFSGLRVGLVGAGGISHEHASAWLALGVQLTVFSPSGAKSMVDAYGVPSAPSLEELIAASDLIDICAPTASHPQLALAAIAAGKAVVCEKPLALTTDAAAEIADRAAEAGVPLYPAHVVRFFPEYARAQRSVDVGSIGAVTEARFSRVGEFPRWAPWFADEEKSGGIVLDLMIHDLDIARWIVGEVTEVSAERTAGADGVVTAQVVLTHASGARSTVTGEWGAPGTTFATSFSITGPRGELHHDSTPGGAGFGIGEAADHASAGSPFLAQLREFAEALHGGPPARVTAADAVAAVRIARAAIDSIASGRPVRLA